MSGLKARGGITVDIRWTARALVSATLLPRFADSVTVRLGERTLTALMQPGEPLTLTPPQFGPTGV